MEDYIGSYNATVVNEILAEDGIIIGILNMDEFAAGSSTETSYYGPTQNPAAMGRILEVHQVAVQQQLRLKCVTLQ